MKAYTIDGLAASLGLAAPCAADYWVCFLGNWEALGIAVYNTVKRTRHGAWLARRYSARYSAAGLQAAKTVSLRGAL